MIVLLNVFRPSAVWKSPSGADDDDDDDDDGDGFLFLPSSRRFSLRPSAPAPFHSFLHVLLILP